MKRSAWIFLFFLPAFLHAQSFRKGAYTISLNIDLGAYGTVGKDPTGGNRNTDGAVSSIVPLGVEYGLTDRWGLLAEYRGNSYAKDNDTASAGNADLSIGANYHMLITDYFNMFTGFRMGLSGFRYDNKINGSYFTALGRQLQADIGANLFVGKNLAFNIHAGFNHLGYPKGTVRDTLGFERPYSLQLNGTNIGIGILYRIPN